MTEFEFSLNRCKLYVYFLGVKVGYNFLKLLCEGRKCLRTFLKKRNFDVDSLP